MIGRRSVWADADIQRLSRDFVCAADEVWRLQTGTDAECRFFQAVAEQGHYGGRPGTTRQGIYVLTPGGVLLGSRNHNRAEVIAALLRESLERWHDLPPEQRRLPADHPVRPESRHEDRFPADGLVLTVITRDLARLDDPTLPPGPWNRDHAWFTAAERLA